MKKPKNEILYKKGRYYHVYNRGHRKGSIFKNSKDYEQFVYLVRKYVGDYDIGLICYCLMPNHYHFIFKLGESRSDISRFMQRLLTAYVLYFNRKYRFVGTLFQGKFQARMVNDFDDLFGLIDYIKVNPLEAGLSRKNGRYKWFYLRKRISKVGPKVDQLLKGIDEDG